MLDLLIDNANVMTMDEARPSASRIGIWNGLIVGLDEQVGGQAARLTVDLAGATVLPGFIDAHSHLAWTGLAANMPDVSRCGSVDDVLSVVSEAVERASQDAWVDIGGYDQRNLGRHLTRDDLDRVSAGRKINMLHASGHACVANSAAIELIDKHALASRAGIDRDSRARPTGLFTEADASLVAGIRNPYSLTELGAALQTAASLCARQGVTFVAEAGIGGDMVSRSPVEGGAYQDAVRARRVPIRLQLMITRGLLATTGTHDSDPMNRAFALGLHSGFGSPRLSLGALKIWLDGGMMARTAALSEPYVGSDSAGQLAPDLAAITDDVLQAHTAGWQVALHAIGDRAVDTALDICEHAQRTLRRPDARHRIEHAGLVRPDQLDRMARLEVTAVIQPTFLYEFGSDYAGVMGAARADWMYRARSFIDRGIPIAGSSDGPVTDGDPLRAMAFMMTRRSKEGNLIGPGEAVTIDEALAAYTSGAARACNVEDRLGTIESGKLADLVVLDGDPRTVEPLSLPDLTIVATVVEGALVHGAWPRTQHSPE